MDFDAHTLRVLEYAQVIEKLAARAACALGAERARELIPSPVASFVRERQQETSEARLLTAQHGPLPLGGIYDIRPSLVRSEVGQSLSTTEFLNLASTLIGGSKLKAFLLRQAEKAPLLADRAKGIEEFPQLIGDIQMAIGRAGDVLDSASPALASVRSRMKTASARITERLNQYLSSSTYRPMLQDAVVVMRDDRRCLPVRAEFKREIRGIVHDQSASGATLFIEPLAIVEMNNELRQLEATERREIERVLAKLTASVQRVATRIHGTVEIVAGIDLASAKAKLADDMNATEPAFNKNGIVRLREARHPLLDPEIVVPITVSLGENFTTLLITGPNTGGKTVTLKTVGLLTLMAQAGMQIPAGTGSELALFDQIFADIGDEQSIAQSLSTFSAHITNIVRILKSVGMHALVLLDEIGAGTDPGEGASLAKAILDYLLKHNARVIATTHYGELKEYAYSREGIENAAVEFDPQSLSPTYRILQGIPGTSNAFYIARRLGMPNGVIEGAKEMLGRQDVEAGVLMQQLERSKRIADEERRRAEKVSRDLDEMKLKYEARLRDLEILRREAKERATEEARDLIRRKTEKMDNIIGELRRIGKEGRKTQSARKKMKETSEELIGGIGYEKEPLPVEEATDVPTSLKRGEKVRVLSLGGATGEVLEDSRDGEAVVQVGLMRVTVPMTALRLAHSNTPRAPIAQPNRSGDGTAASHAARLRERIPGGEGAKANGVSGGNAATLARTKTESIAPEIKLIGLRVDAALPRLDKYLDDGYAVGLPTARIVHGKGTGQLRKAIWEFLKGDARVGGFEMAHPDDGGAGATVIRFRE